VSEYGDSFILPQLLQLSQRFGVPLRLNRDAKQAPLFKKSLFVHLLRGAWFIVPASQILFRALAH